VLAYPPAPKDLGCPFLPDRAFIPPLECEWRSLPTIFFSFCLAPDQHIGCSQLFPPLAGDPSLSFQVGFFSRSDRRGSPTFLSHTSFFSSTRLFFGFPPLCFLPGSAESYLKYWLIFPSPRFPCLCFGEIPCLPSGWPGFLPSSVVWKFAAIF